MYFSYFCILFVIPSCNCCIRVNLNTVVIDCLHALTYLIIICNIYVYKINLNLIIGSLFTEIVLSGKEYVNSGETIRLVCNVTGNTEVPQDVDWFKNGHLLRSLVSKKIQIHKETSIAKRKLDSVLEIRDSKLDDSGVYVCRNSEELIANQKVIVLNGRYTVVLFCLNIYSSLSQ